MKCPPPKLSIFLSDPTLHPLNFCQWPAGLSLHRGKWKPTIFCYHLATFVPKFCVDELGFEHCPHFVSFHRIIPIIRVVKEYPRVKDYGVNGIHNFVFGYRVAYVNGILLDGAGTRDGNS